MEHLIAEHDTADHTCDEPVDVLVVDDKPGNLTAISELLDAPGRNIITATSGEEALRILLTRDVAVIIMDVRMPEMDGFETASRIRSRDKSANIPIIFMTAMEKRADLILKGYEVGAVDYIVKPLEPKILKSKVGVFVDLYCQTRATRAANAQLSVLAEQLSQSNRDLKQFAYSASHDLKEPLRMMRIYSELLEKNYAERLDGKALSYLEQIMTSSKRMTRLIEGLLDYSRIRSKGLHLEPTSLDALLSDVMNDLAIELEEGDAGIEHSRLPTAVIDRMQIYRVFQNIILNAIKFRGDQPPRLRISGETIKEDHRDVVLVSISDNGIGIDDQFAERVFDLFRRLHTMDAYPGEGLGLSICKRIVELHEGRIWVESRGKGKGCTFYFTLPAAGRP